MCYADIDLNWIQLHNFSIIYEKSAELKYNELSRDESRASMIIIRVQAYSSACLPEEKPIKITP